MNLKGIAVLGLLPDSIQSMTVFSGGVSASSDARQASRDALAFMAAPEVAQLKLEQGMSAA
jgi:molybdate transport system substrate-binding protein